LLGRNLQPVAEALIVQNCAYAEEYDPAGPQPEHGQPVIERVEILAPKGA